MDMNLGNLYFADNDTGFYYGIGTHPVKATTHNAKNKKLIFSINEEEGFDLFDADKIDIIDEIRESESMFSLGFFSDDIVTEATRLRLPADSEKDLRGLNYYERLDKVKNVKHFDLWIEPQFERPDKYSSCWIWLEMPKTIDDVDYIPIIIHRGGGVSIHPDYHKYFLRSFNKNERHLILGFCYVYGPLIEGVCNINGNKGSDISKKEIEDLELSALYYKDNEAPKRINLGPDKNLAKRYQPSSDDYYRWVEEIKKLK